MNPVLEAVEVFVENTIIQIQLSPKEYSTTIKNDTKKPDSNVIPLNFGLEEMIRQGARQIISQALEAELAKLLGQFSNVLTLDGKPAVVRNGYLPERSILTAVGPVPARCPEYGIAISWGYALTPIWCQAISANRLG